MNPIQGGRIHKVGEEYGVVYNHQCLHCTKLLTPDNCTLSILTRNRAGYLMNLIRSIDTTFPHPAPRVVVANNCEDDTVQMVQDNFPNWKVIEVRPEDYSETSAGMLWLRQRYPQKFDSSYDTVAGYTTYNNRGWLQNMIYKNRETPWLIHFDDDCLVKPGWFEYYQTMQNAVHAYCVMNNFAFFAIHEDTFQKIGYADERFVTPHGAHDNDYVARINEGGLLYVLGFNKDHNWAGAGPDNPRGSATGNDRFIHLYARAQGGWSPAEEQKKSLIKKPFLNPDWFNMKWKKVDKDNGIMDRPPFKNYWLERQVEEIS